MEGGRKEAIKQTSTLDPPASLTAQDNARDDVKQRAAAESLGKSDITIISVLHDKVTPPPRHSNNEAGSLKNHVNMNQIALKLGAVDDQPLSIKVLDIQPERKSTFFQATLNCVSMLYGLGILSSPFAVAQAGWMGAIIALGIATGYAYSASLMSKCARKNQNSGGGGTYQAVASEAIGPRAERIITPLFYIEILGTLAGYCISMGDNLTHIFPQAEFSLPGLTGRNLMIFLAAMLILPTVWVRDLSALAFTSMWCITSSLLLLVGVLLLATVSGIGFHHTIPFLRLRGVPVAAGLYAFSFGGTSVFPSICISMKDPSKFNKAVVLSFVIATASMMGLGIVGAYMFGEATDPQITLNMPSHLITTKIILWMTVLTPMFKFALQLSPITTAVEATLNTYCKATSKPLLYCLSTLMRSMVLAGIVIFSMVFPYFEFIVALVGSSMTMAICLLFPCAFYFRFFWDKLRRRTILLIGSLMLLGLFIGAVGTVVSVQGLVNKTKSS